MADRMDEQTPSTDQPDRDIGDATTVRPGQRVGDDERRDSVGEHEHAFEATFIAARYDFGKADRDLVFATAAIKSGRITERQLSKAVADWTVHGDESLADHLVAKGLLSEAEREQLETDAEGLLQSAAEDLVGMGDTEGSAS